MAWLPPCTSLQIDDRERENQSQPKGQIAQYRHTTMTDVSKLVDLAMHTSDHTKPPMIAEQIKSNLL
jgi:hypothetical protein